MAPQSSHKLLFYSSGNCIFSNTVPYKRKSIFWKGNAVLDWILPGRWWLHIPNSSQPFSGGSIFHLSASLLTPNLRKINSAKPIAQSNAFKWCQTASARLETTSTLGHVRRIFALEFSPSAEDPKLGLLDISEVVRFNDGDQLGRMSPAAGRLISGPSLPLSMQGPSRYGS